MNEGIGYIKVGIDKDIGVSRFVIVDGMDISHFGIVKVSVLADLVDLRIWTYTHFI